MKERSWFSAMYDNYVGLLFNYGFHLVPDSDLVKDCIHDLFIEIWNSGQKFDEIDNPKAYLLKSLRYKLHRQIRQKNLNHRKLIDYYRERFQFEVSCEHLMITDQLNSEMIKSLRNNVNLLSNRQREAIFHVFYHEMSYDEAASVLSLSKKTVYNLIHGALKTLRYNLKEENEKVLRA
jgi:RNA polymerase sigma factor (sigma-70 family)